MINTVDEVIEALGGPIRVAYMVGVGPTAVSNWKKSGRIASSSYLIMIEALRRRGMTAPASLWGMKEDTESGRQGCNDQCASQ